MNNVPALIAYLDADLRYKVVNRRYAEMLGTTVQQVLNKTPADFLDPESYALARPMMDRALAGETVTFEQEFAYRDGRRRWISVTYASDSAVSDSAVSDSAVSDSAVSDSAVSDSAVSDTAASGRGGGFYAMMIDIDDLKRTEGALRSSEERFRDIVLASSDWFWEVDAELGLSYLSEPAGEVSDLEIEKLRGRKPWEIIESGGQDGEGLAFRSLLEAQKPFRDFHGRYEGGSEGRLRHLSISGIPIFDKEGRFKGYRGSARDITTEMAAIAEKEGAQDFFGKVLEMFAINFVIYDADEVTIYHSDTFQAVAKRNGWNFEVGGRYEDLLREVARNGSALAAEGRQEEWIAERLRGFRALKVGEKETSFRAKYRWPDDSEHWMDIRRVRTEEGYTLAGNIEITELVNHEEQLRHAQKMEAVGQLTGGIAHDFNNILAVVLGNLDLVAERVQDHPECQALASKAVRAAERGALLTQRLLAFSRKQPLMPRPTDINRLIGGIDDLLRGALGELSQLEFVRAAGLWRCEVDPSQVENALLNLAINARDAMPDGGKLTIETGNAYIDDEYAAAQLEVTAGQYVMIAVTDTGCGMTDEISARVFEPFFTTKEAGQGSGLGLSMVYGFVKQSGGHIAVYSEVGEGTTIKIYLPRSLLAHEEDTETTFDVAQLAGQGQRVLVVEDDAMVRELACDLLTELGYRVSKAEDGPAALRFLEGNEAVELLLTDAVLPGGMNGRELANAVTAACPDTAVLFMSGYTENAIIHHGRLDHDAVLLQKPFRKKDLALKAHEVLSARRPGGTNPGESEP